MYTVKKSKPIFNIDFIFSNITETIEECDSSKM